MCTPANGSILREPFIRYVRSYKVLFIYNFKQFVVHKLTTETETDGVLKTLTIIYTLYILKFYELSKRLFYFRVPDT